MKVPRPALPLVTVAALGIGAAVALALPAGAAVSVQSQSPPVSALSLGTTATLDAKGAAVFASVTVVCSPGAYAYVNLTLTERVGGNRIASGQTGTQVDPCTGTEQSFTLAVTPGQYAFRQGTAYGQASLNFCDWTGCHTIYDKHDVQIVKP